MERSNEVLEQIRGAVVQVGERVTKIEGELAQNRERLTRVEGLIAQLGERVAQTGERLAKVEGIAGQIGERITNVEADMRDIRADLRTKADRWEIRIWFLVLLAVMALLKFVP